MSKARKQELFKLVLVMLELLIKETIDLYGKTLEKLFLREWRIWARGLES